MIVGRFLAWLETASAEHRAQGAFALARLWVEPEMDDAERDAAEAAMTLLLDDAEFEVRLSLAKALAPLETAPRHVLLSLAGDEPQIAMTVLLRSPAFLDGELVAMAKCGIIETQTAIACRRTVSPVVADAIASHGEADACFGLLMNPGAEPAPSALQTIAERHGAATAIRRLLLRRPSLLASTRLLLIDKLGETLRAEIAGTPGLSAARLDQLLADHGERAIIAYACKAHEAELPDIAAALIGAGRMTAAFLLRCICMGNITLYAGSMAQLSGLPTKRVEAALDPARRSAFRALYLKSGLPDSAFEVFASALDIWRKVLASSDTVDATRMTWLVTRQLLSTYRGRTDTTVDALLVLLRRLAAEAARRNARNEAVRITAQVRDDEQRLLEALARDPQEIALQAFPVIEVPQPVLAGFALHFAEELVELEDAFSAGEPTAPTAESPVVPAPAKPLRSVAANDDAPLAKHRLTIDMGEASARSKAA